mgnify:CR=1 FL=1
MLKLPPPGPDNLDFLYNLGLHNVDLGLLGRDIELLNLTAYKADPMDS